MRLYAGSAKQFVSDTVRIQVADKLKEAFFGCLRASRRKVSNEISTRRGYTTRNRVDRC